MTSQLQNENESKITDSWLWLLTVSQQSSTKADKHTVHIALCDQNSEQADANEDAVSLSFSTVKDLCFSSRSTSNKNSLATECRTAEIKDEKASMKASVAALIYGSIHYNLIKSNLSLPTRQSSKLIKKNPVNVLVQYPLDQLSSDDAAWTHPLLEVLLLLLKSAEEEERLIMVQTTILTLNYLLIILKPLNINIVSRIFKIHIPWLMQQQNSSNLFLVKETQKTQISLEALILRIINILPISTFSEESDNLIEVVPLFCELFTTPINSIGFKWLSNIKFQSSSSSSSCEIELSSLAIKVLLPSLIFYKAVSWGTVDALTPEALLNSSIGLCTTAVAARKAAMCLIDSIWNYSIAEPKIDNNESSNFIFRKSICILLGREFIFCISRLGRVAEIQPIFKFLSNTMPESWLRTLSMHETMLTDFGALKSYNIWPAGRNHQESIIFSSEESDSSFDNEFLDNILIMLMGHKLVKQTKSVLHDSLGIRFVESPPSQSSYSKEQKIFTPQYTSSLRPTILFVLLSLRCVPPIIISTMSSETIQTIKFFCDEVSLLNVRMHFKLLIENTGQSDLITKIPPILLFLNLIHRESMRQDTSQSWDINLFDICENKKSITSGGIGIMELYTQLLQMSQYTNNSAIPVTSQATVLQIAVADCCFDNMDLIYHELEALENLPATRNTVMGHLSGNTTDSVRTQETDDNQTSETPDSIMTMTPDAHCDDNNSCKLVPTPAADVQTPSTTENEFTFRKNTNIVILTRIIQRIVCLGNSEHITETPHEEFMPDLSLDIIWKLMGLQQRADNTLIESATQVHPLLLTILHFISLFIDEWNDILAAGNLVSKSLELSLTEYSIWQLKHASALPCLSVLLEPKDMSCLRNPHVATVGYYGALCRHTIVGRLLLLQGIEPQTLWLSDVCDSSWPETVEARKRLPFPVAGPTVLEEQMMIHLPPFAAMNLPIRATFQRVLQKAFENLFFELPNFWPMERLTATLKNLSYP